MQPLAAPDQADAVPHHAAEPCLQIVDALASRPLERGEDAPRGGVHRRARHPQAGPSRHPVGHHVAGDAAEDGGLGDAIAAEAIGSVHAARVLARGEQPSRSVWQALSIAIPPIMKCVVGPTSTGVRARS